MIEADTATYEPYQNHDWVLDYEQFEAVLVCKNPLPKWQTDSVVRAFQTFQFADTSDSLDDIELKHIDTGAIVQYDGNVVAIRYSLDLVNMLPDLVLTLNSLGWEKAGAYHAPQTIAMFLDDLGRAIPASVDFDVEPVGDDYKISAYPQAASLLAAAQLNGINANEQLGILSEEFRALGTPLISADAFKPLHPILLLEDPLLDSMLEDTVTLNLTKTNIGTNTTEVNDHLPLFLMPDTPADRAVHRTLPGSMQKNTPEVQAANSTSMEALRSTPQPASVRKPDINLVRLGNGFLVFDTPQNPVSETALRGIFGEQFGDASLIEHIYPGKLNNPLHWDFLSEIPVEQALFADTIAGFMQLSGPDRTLTAALLASHAQSTDNNDLRSIINLIVEKCSKDAQSGSEYLADKYPSQTARDIILNADYSGVYKTLLSYAGQIALIPESSFFMDVYCKSDDKLDFRPFSLRKLKSQSAPWAYIVHASQHDTILSKWATTLLFSIATHLSAQPHDRENSLALAMGRKAGI